MKRSIRLKERLISANRLHTPSEEYKKVRPNLELRDYYEATSEDGTIKTELSIVSDDKIIFLGGSFIENLYADSRSRITSVFEKKLNEEGYKIQVVNAGVSGATTLNLFNTFINKYVKYKPKAVFFFIPTNDGYCLDLKGGLWNTMKSYSNLYNIDFFSELERSNYQEKLDDICNIYSLMIDACKLFDVELYICTSPIVEEVSDFYLVSEERQKNLNLNRFRVMDVVLEFCKKKGIRTIDLRNKFIELKYMFFDDVHSNSHGSEVIANYLFKEICDDVYLSSIYRDKNNVVSVLNLENEILLSHNIFWSDPIFLDYRNCYKGILSLDINCDHETKKNNALFCIDFCGKLYTEEQSGLFLSPSVGNFQYLQTKESINCNIQHTFFIPQNNGAIRIGFLLWDTDSRISLSDIKLYLHLDKN